MVILICNSFRFFSQLQSPPLSSDGIFNELLFSRLIICSVPVMFVWMYGLLYLVKLQRWSDAWKIYVFLSFNNLGALSAR